jgi:long-chain acyl-CoA synthetase
MLANIRNFARFAPEKKEAKTLVFAENCVEWIYSFFSIWQNRGIAIPVDASSTIDDVAYIMNDAQPEAIWVTEQTEEVAREAIKKAGVKTTLLRMDNLTSLVPHEETKEEGISFEDSDIAVILYTSGTTGFPKGVMLTFHNLLVNINAISSKEVPIFNKKSSTLILLPLHHVMPLVGTLVAPIFTESQVVLCPTMSGPDIMAALQRGKVTIIVGVPRLWQTLYYGIKKKIDAKGAVVRALYSLCEKVGSYGFSKKIFASVHENLGGNLQYCVSGGAALDTEIGNGMKTLGITVLEGYGMTETSPMISFTRPGDIIPGCSGLPLPCCECKIIDGELCVKGENVMLGYYNRPDETAALFDDDGYLHTGDLARFDEKGRVYITGRKKEIIVLSNGKNVQPVEIEFKLEKYDQFVKECAVSYYNDKLVAVIVPQDNIAQGKTDAEIEALLKHEVLEPYNNEAMNYKKVMSIFVLHGALPRTRLSKIQRFKVLDMLKNGVSAANTQVEEIVEPDMEEYRIMRDYVMKEKKLDVVRPTDHLETDLGLDSLDRVSMQEFIMQTFGADVNADSILSYATLENLAKHISKAKTHMDVAEDIDWHKLLTSASAVVPSAPSAMLPLGAKLFKGLNHLYFRLSIKGKENIPANAPFIIAPNHESFLDGPIVTSGLSWNTIKDTYFYATEEHFNTAAKRSIAGQCNVILMQMSNLKNSILHMAQVLRAGKNLMIFPEGRRTNTGEMGEFKKTFAILSKELQIPILPVRITGAFEALPRHKTLPRPRKITVEFLKPLIPDADMTYEEISDKVKKMIAGE